MKRSAASNLEIDKLNPKKLKMFSNLDDKVNEIPLEDRRLDSLARLFQETSQGCAAVCLINQTIIIADNEIHSGTKLGEAAGNKIKLIKNVMRYFSDLANNPKEYKKSREEVFKEICISRLKGEEKGYIKLDDIILANIAEDVLFTYKTQNKNEWREKYIKEITNYKSNQKPYIANAYEMVALLARDFLKIEKLILDRRDDGQSDLVKAFKGKENNKIFVDYAGGVFEEDKGKIQKEEGPGYIVLTIDRHGVHAETKIIEYLIWTGILAFLEEGERIYIGISKLCCQGCSNFVKSVNEIFAAGEELFITRGAHELQPSWNQPIICTFHSVEHVLGYYKSDKTLKLEPVYSTKEEGYNKMKKCIYIERNIIKKLSIKAPELKSMTKELSVYQTAYSISSIGSQSPNTSDSMEENHILKNISEEEIFKALLMRYDDPQAEILILKLKDELHKFEAKTFEAATIPFDSVWYDYLAIKDGLINKGINAEHLLYSVENNEQLDERWNEIKEANSFYIIPLNVNAIDGSFTATNHWVGLYISTNENSKIMTVRYLNPIGQIINKALAVEVYKRTGIEAIDLTEGKGIQFTYFNHESGAPELHGNINDCGPMLVQLFYELIIHKEILTYSLSKKESLAFGQKCRQEQYIFEHEGLVRLRM